MKKIEQKDIQKLEYQILKAFDSFAKENDIKYFLCGGTLLGAVRHKGFIPWDDDIDICLLREDFDKLTKIVKQNRVINEKFKFYLPLDKDYIYPFIKLVDQDTIVYEKDIKEKHCLGVWVDVFCLDTWPTDENKTKKIVKNISKYKFFNKICVAGNLTSMKKKILAVLGKTFCFFFYHNKDSHYWIKSMLDELDFSDKGDQIGNILWNLNNKEFFKKEWFDETIYQQFEDQEYPIPKGYKEYLTIMYGDYMTLPKEEDRITHEFNGYYIKK